MVTLELTDRQALLVAGALQLLGLEIDQGNPFAIANSRQWGTAHDAYDLSNRIIHAEVHGKAPGVDWHHEVPTNS